jgi:hypothetical protein
MFDPVAKGFTHGGAKAGQCRVGHRVPQRERSGGA